MTNKNQQQPSKQMSAMEMLYGTQPLVINPDLAKEIGLNEALVLQQVKYWHDRARYEFEGEYWFYKTVEQWGEQFKFWSPSTIKRTLSNLEKLGLLKKRRDLHGKIFGKHSNKTSWYAIKCEEVNLTPSSKNDISEEVEMTPSEEVNLSPSEEVNLTPSSDQRLLTEITTEIKDPPVVPQGTEKPEIEVLDFLNKKRKSVFDALGLGSKTIKPVSSNLKPIKARLKEYSFDEIKLVIEHLSVTWGADPSMRQYLVPVSIFRASKFDGKHIAAQEWKLNGCQAPHTKTNNVPDFDDTSWANDLLPDFMQNNLVGKQ